VGGIVEKGKGGIRINIGDGKVDLV